MKSLIKGEVTRTMESLTKQLKILSNATSSDDHKQLKMKSNAIIRITNDMDKIHGWFFGDIDKKPDDNKRQRAVEKIVDYDTNLFFLMIENISILEFNAAKRGSEILKYVIKNCKNNKSDQYIRSLTDAQHQNPMIQCLINQYNQNCSQILHEMVKRKELMAMFLSSIQIDYNTTKIQMEDEKEDSDLYDFVHVMLILVQNADLIISSAAFETLYCLLTRDDKYVSNYLKSCFDDLFDKINDIIHCDNCVIQKKFLQLLHDILTKQNNYDIMMKYIENKKYLLCSMNLMKKYEKNSISFEAWHVFKLFVANKDKQNDIHAVLWTNKDYLIQFLSSFHLNKVGDEQFAMERKLIIKHLQNYQNKIDS